MRRKMKCRKPTDSRNEIYPKVDVDPEGRIWVATCNGGKWKKLPPGRAPKFIDRIQRGLVFHNYLNKYK